MDELCIGVREIANYVHVSPGSVPYLVETEGLPARMVNGRWRASKSDLDQWMGKSDDKLTRKVDTLIGVLSGLRAQIDGLILEFEQLREG